MNTPPFPISVLIDNIRSMYNVGSFFRTCDGAGVEKLYLGGYTPSPPRKEISKTALGAENIVPFEHHAEALSLIARLKKENYQIIAVEITDKAVEYTDYEPQYPCCLIFGNELDGVSTQLIEQADAVIKIPMHGIKNSLNVVVSAGIVIYDVVNKFKHRQL